MIDKNQILLQISKVLDEELEEYSVNSLKRLQETLRKLRKAQKISLTDVSRDVEGLTDPSHLSHFETGDTNSCPYPSGYSDEIGAGIN